MMMAWGIALWCIEMFSCLNVTPMKISDVSGSRPSLYSYFIWNIADHDYLKSARGFYFFDKLYYAPIYMHVITKQLFLKNLK